MKHSTKTGLCFGLTSAVITTLGLISGLHSFSGSRIVIIGGILTIAIADAFSDALGIHVSEESEAVHTSREIWEATLTTFLAKFLFALTFIIPVLLLELSTAFMASLTWGVCLLAVLSYFLAKEAKEHYWKIIIEHLTIAILVVALTHYIGDWVAAFFG